MTEAELLDVYRKTLGALYAYVSRRTGGDQDLTEDVVQEAWLRALGDWQQSNSPDEPLAWLKRVASNLLLSYFRQARPQQGLVNLSDIEDRESEPGTPHAAALLQWGMGQLRKGQLSLLEGFYFDGQNSAALAAQLGISQRAVEGRLRRSRIALSEIIEPWIDRDLGDSVSH